MPVPSKFHNITYNDKIADFCFKDPWIINTLSQFDVCEHLLCPPLDWLQVWSLQCITAAHCPLHYHLVVTSLASVQKHCRKVDFIFHVKSVKSSKVFGLSWSCARTYITHSFIRALRLFLLLHEIFILEKRKKKEKTRVKRGNALVMVTKRTKLQGRCQMSTRASPNSKFNIPIKAYYRGEMVSL